MEDFQYLSGTLPNFPPGCSLPKSDVKLTVSQIQEAVCFYFNLQPEDLLSKSREQPYLKARQIYRFLLHDEGMSYRQVAEVCDISHPTAIECLQAVQGYLDVSDPYIVDLWAIKGYLNAPTTANVIKLHKKAS